MLLWCLKQLLTFRILVWDHVKLITSAWIVLRLRSIIIAADEKTDRFVDGSVSHAKIVHFVHLFVWASTSISPLHVFFVAIRSNLPIFVTSFDTSPFQHGRLVMTYLFDEFHLLFSFVFPAHDVVSWLSLLQSFKHRFIVMHYSMNFLCSYGFVQGMVLLSLFEELLAFLFVHFEIPSFFLIIGIFFKYLWIILKNRVFMNFFHRGVTVALFGDSTIFWENGLTLSMLGSSGDIMTLWWAVENTGCLVEIVSCWPSKNVGHALEKNSICSFNLSTSIFNDLLLFALDYWILVSYRLSVVNSGRSSLNFSSMKPLIFKNPLLMKDCVEFR